MKKVYIILFSVLFLLVTKNAFAAKGKAAVYKVTMNAAALCTGNSSGTTCDGKVTVGSAYERLKTDNGDVCLSVANTDAMYGLGGS